MFQVQGKHLQLGPRRFMAGPRVQGVLGFATVETVGGAVGFLTAWTRTPSAAAMVPGVGAAIAAPRATAATAMVTTF